MKQILLTQGKLALVDDADFDGLNRFNWYARKLVLKNRTVWYAVRQVTIGRKRQRPVLMHAEITGYAKTDHKDGDGLNNQRSNLRPATQVENQQNQHKRIGCSSRFKGVCWHKQVSRWRADIRHNGQRQHLGLFDDELEAARAYDAAARALFGEFALTNL